MPSQFLAELEEIYTGAQAGPTNRWSACNFFDKVIFATGSVSPQYWPGGGDARPLPGLPSGIGYDGVEAIAGHIVLWKDETIKWGDLNDFTNFIPVGETAVSLRATTVNAFTQPAADHVTPDWIHLDEDLQSFVEGQFVRVDLNSDDPTAAKYSFYEVDSVASAGVTGTTTAFKQAVAADAEEVNIYLNAAAEFVQGSRLNVNGRTTLMEVAEDSRALTGFFTSTEQSESAPAIGGTFKIKIAENPSSLKVGDVVSVGRIPVVGLDLYEVVTVAFSLELRRLGIGTDKQATGYKFAEGTYLTFQPFVKINNGNRPVNIPASADLSCQMAIKLKGLGLTGELPEGDIIPAGAEIQSLDRNEAGEVINAGSDINGPVFAVVSLGEYGIILKERSLQSMQYTGIDSGTFFIRSEILGEGLISRHAWTRTGDKQIAFFGHKHIYIYSGGQTLSPIALQHSKEVFKELDRSRSSEIVLYHNEQQQELWVYYPTLSNEKLKVLVWNYRFNTVVQDTYSPDDFTGITALGGIDVEIAPTWRELSDTLTWETETRRWRELVEDGEQRYTLIAVGGAEADPALGELDSEDGVPRLLLHGRKFSRAAGDNCDEEGYFAFGETQDFDFNDGAAFKYLDGIQIDVEIADTDLARPMFLNVQIGARNNLDSAVRWSSPSKVEVSGNGTIVTKVNLRAAGRFLRVRFFSENAGDVWRVAGFRLLGRKGGTY